MKRGIFALAPIILMMAALGILIAFGLTNIIGEGVKIPKTIKLNTYEMSNALDAAESYMGAAFRYSIYQACYDILKNGGWYRIPQKNQKDGHAVWYNSEDSNVNPPEEQEFTDSLGSIIKSYLNVYTEGCRAWKSCYEFMGKYGVYLPEYIAIGIDGDKYSASAGESISVKKIILERNESIFLEKDSSLETSVDIDCSGIYEKAKEIYPSISPVLESILQTGFENLKTEYSQTLSNEIPNPTLERIADSVFANNVGRQINDEEEDIENMLRGLISEVFTQSTDGDYLIEYDIHELVFDVMPVSCPESMNDAGDITYTCTFDYMVSASLKVTITNTNSERKFPVYDGSHVTFDSMSIIFLIRDVEKKGF